MGHLSIRLVPYTTYGFILHCIVLYWSAFCDLKDDLACVAWWTWTNVAVENFLLISINVAAWVVTKKFIRRWDSQTWLDDIGGNMPDLPVWPPPSCLFGYLRGVAQPHAGWGDLLGGGDPFGRSSWSLVGELPDGHATIRCKNIPEKLNPWVGCSVHARYRRQTDLPCH